MTGIINTIHAKIEGTISRGIKAAEVDESGHLIFTLTDNSIVDIGNVVGPEGDPGGSPAVTITDIEGGHRVTITDEEHPQGQSFDVMDGEDGDGNTVDTFGDLLTTTGDRVLVLSNSPVAADGEVLNEYGDGGQMWYEVREGEDEPAWGIERTDGSFVHPMVSQDAVPPSNCDLTALWNICKGYLGNTKLYYKAGYSLFEQTADIDEQGRYPIYCSSFVSAILGGITWENSRYDRGYGTAEDKGNLFGESIGNNFECPMDGGNINSRMMKFFAAKKRLFKLPDPSVDENYAHTAANMLCAGDVIFFGDFRTEPTYPTRWYHVHHCAIVLAVNTTDNTAVVIESTTMNDTRTWLSEPGETITCSLLFLSTLWNTDNYASACLFARPDYGMTDAKTEDATNAALGGGSFSPAFVPMLWLPDNDVEYAGRVKNSQHGACTPEFMAVSAGDVIRYTGITQTGHRMAAVFYDADYKPLRGTVPNYPYRFALLDTNGTKHDVTAPTGARFMRLNYHAPTSGEITTVRIEALNAARISITPAVLNSYRTSAAQDVIDATKADKPIIKTSMDAVAVAGARYYLGQQSAVTITMPTDAQLGQEIIVCFSSGATAATLTCDLTGFDFVPKANKTNKIVFTLVDATAVNQKWTVEVEES